MEKSLHKPKRSWKSIRGPCCFTFYGDLSNFEVVESDRRSWLPVKVNTEEITNKIHDIALADRRVKIGEIVEMVNISDDRVRNILHKHLRMKKPSARLVQPLLTVKQKRNRLTPSQRCLDIYRIIREFLWRFVSVDETSHYSARSKRTVKTVASVPMKAKMTPWRLLSGTRNVSLLLTISKRERQLQASVPRSQRRCHGDCLLGLAKYRFYWLFGKGKNDYRRV